MLEGTLIKHAHTHSIHNSHVGVVKYIAIVTRHLITDTSINTHLSLQGMSSEVAGETVVPTEESPQTEDNQQQGELKS